MNELKKYNWKCPHPGCIYDISAYSEVGRDTMRTFHEESHRREREFVLGVETKVPKDINKLELTVADKAFLKTRGIKPE